MKRLLLSTTAVLSAAFPAEYAAAWFLLNHPAVRVRFTR